MGASSISCKAVLPGHLEFQRGKQVLRASPQSDPFEKGMMSILS